MQDVKIHVVTDVLYNIADLKLIPVSLMFKEVFGSCDSFLSVLCCSPYFSVYIFDAVFVYCPVT